MGVFSEIHAEQEANGLEEILFAAIDTDNTDITSFCKEHIFRKYTSALSEAFNSDVSDNYLKILDIFNDKS